MSHHDEPSSIESRLLKIQRFINKMPSLSTTVSKVLDICGRPDAAPSDLNRVISYDPVLTGKLIRLINSAYYGLPQRVTSLTRAIIMLGINTVKNMVLATSVLASFKGKLDVRGLTVDDFWAHSLGVAVIAKVIARKLGVPLNEHEEFFVAGLMHDLGKIPLMKCFPELYQNVLNDATRSKEELRRAEISRIGIDHCQVGHLIAAKWKLDGRTQTAISRHHDLPTKHSDDGHRLWCITGLANQLALALTVGFAGDADIDHALAHGLSELMDIEFNELARIKSGIDIEIEKAKIFLQVAA